MEKKYYKVKTIPFIVREKKDGVVYKKFGLTDEETKKMSCDPRILWHRHGSIYFAELPLMYHEQEKLKDSLYYIYDELTEEEKEIFKDRVVDITVTIPGVIKIYSTEKTKPKKKIRRKNKDTNK